MDGRSAKEFTRSRFQARLHLKFESATMRSWHAAVLEAHGVNSAAQQTCWLSMIRIGGGGVCNPVGEYKRTSQSIEGIIGMKRVGIEMSQKQCRYRGRD